MNETRRALASNPALSVDEITAICGPIPEILLNQQFTLSHLSEHRFHGLLDRDYNYHSAGNYQSNPTHAIKQANDNAWYRNPRVFDHRDAFIYDLDDDTRLVLAKNLYNKHPVWVAECRRSEASRALWLRLVWRGLVGRLPVVLVEVILGIWYDPAPEA